MYPLDTEKVMSDWKDFARLGLIDKAVIALLAPVYLIGIGRMALKALPSSSS